MVRTKSRITKSKNNYRFPWDKLEVGEYFNVSKNILKDTPSGHLSVRTAACQRARMHGEKYKTKMTCRGLRVMRVA